MRYAGAAPNTTCVIYARRTSCANSVSPTIPGLTSRLKLASTLKQQ